MTNVVNAPQWADQSALGSLLREVTPSGIVKVS